MAFPCAQKSIQKSIWSRCRILHITLDEEMHLTGKEVEVWWWACDYRTYSSSHICNNPEAAGLMDIRPNPLIVGAAEASAWTQHSKDGAPSFRMQYILQINSPYTVLSPPKGRTKVWKKLGPPYLHSHDSPGQFVLLANAQLECLLPVGESFHQGTQ